MIPAELIDTVVRYAKAHLPHALFVRHAEREAVLDLRNHEAARLTPRGHEQAREAGALLANAARDLAGGVRVHHSTVERCGETARGLVDGVRAAGGKAQLVSEVPALASPFVLDRARVDDIFVGGVAGLPGPASFHAFLRAWFDGEYPRDVLMPRADAALTQLAAVVEHLEDREHPEGAQRGRFRSDALHVFVSHDWNILLVREEVLSLKLEEGWPHFLDGFALAVDGDELLIETGGRAGRHPVPRR